jgi:anti-sigma regulatory factor (Ser/Thr protein kinase)/CheY-like chemotaxis protein
MFPAGFHHPDWHVQCSVRAIMKRVLAIEEPGCPSPIPDSLTRDYEVDRACGSVDALRRLRQRAYDVLVTSSRTHVDEDLALFEESRRLRPGLKAIFLAPLVTPPDVIAALRARVFACLVSPFDSSEIADLIRGAAESTDWSEGIQVLSARTEWIALRVTCNLVTADRLTSFMTALRADVDQRVREDLLTAFREVLLNAMEHGAGFDPEKVVDVSAVRTERAVVYYFRDPGPGFDAQMLAHAAIGNPSLDPIAHLECRASQGLRPGGFGMLLVRKLVDEVMYSEAGNEVLLIKHLS